MNYEKVSWINLAEFTQNVKNISDSFVEKYPYNNEKIYATARDFMFQT